MRSLTPLIALLLLLSALPAAAQSVPNCSMRLPALERAACLVRWHKQMTGESVMASSSSSSFAQQQVQVSSASSVAGTVAAPVSCSRLSGVARAQCLVQQRKALLQQIAVTPAKVAQNRSSVATRPSRLRCNRISDGNARSRCLAGN